ncbi:hypothetical protein AAG906_027370 [Vitis piasezkii]
MALPSSSDWDYFTFGEVCIQWQYAVREKLQHLRSNHKRHCRLHQQVPLLMAPTADNSRERCCLYDVMNGKSLWEVQLRQGRWRCEGSSHGWLILVNNDSYKVTLHNPFSGKLIHLPPLEKSSFRELSGSVYRTIFPYKPRRGEADWTYIERLRDVKDIVYSNGLFYVLDGRVRITSPDIHCALDSYLVESPEGDLLRVIKHERGYVIYKLQWFSKNPRWEEVMSLGDVALFLETIIQFLS